MLNKGQLRGSNLSWALKLRWNNGNVEKRCLEKIREVAPGLYILVAVDFDLVMDYMGAF